MLAGGTVGPRKVPFTYSACLPSWLAKSEIPSLQANLFALTTRIMVQQSVR